MRKIDEECEGEEENEVEKGNDKQNQEEQNERRKYDKGFYLMTPHNDERKNEIENKKNDMANSGKIVKTGKYNNTENNLNKNADRTENRNLNQIIKSTSIISS